VGGKPTRAIPVPLTQNTPELAAIDALCGHSSRPTFRSPPHLNAAIPATNMASQLFFSSSARHSPWKRLPDVPLEKQYNDARKQHYSCSHQEAQSVSKFYRTRFSGPCQHLTPEGQQCQLRDSRVLPRGSGGVLLQDSAVRTCGNLFPRHRSETCYPLRRFGPPSSKSHESPGP
jgi:hypothetical protein